MSPLEESPFSFGSKIEELSSKTYRTSEQQRNPEVLSVAYSLPLGTGHKILGGGGTAKFVKVETVFS